MTDEQFKEFVKLVVRHDETSNGHYYIRLQKWLLPVLTAIIGAVLAFATSTASTNAKHDATLDEHTRLLDSQARLLDSIQADIKYLMRHVQRGDK